MTWDGNYELHFVRDGAHDVRDFSDAPKEREVLIERGHEYEVVSRDESGERVKLELREIPAPQRNIKNTNREICAVRDTTVSAIHPYDLRPCTNRRERG